MERQDGLRGVRSHDRQVPAAVAEVFRHGWADTSVRPPLVSGAACAAKRRAAVSERFPGERIVVPSGGLKVRSNDFDYTFRPHSAFVHLTAEQGTQAVPDSVLVFEPTGGGHEVTLFTRQRSPRDAGPHGAEFYSDRQHGEFWVGRRRTLRETADALGVEAAARDSLERALGGGVPTRVVRGEDALVDALVPPSAPADAELLAFLSELRLVKDDWEIEQLRAAVGYTVAGFHDVVGELPHATLLARGERWIEGTFNRRARLEGYGLGFETIAAAGAHACVLHWMRNDGPVREGDLLLLDAGVEADSFYTGDVTRTLPVGGRFTDVQRRVYDLVFAAQSAGIAALRPGARYGAFHDAAMRVIAEGLDAWGLRPAGGAMPHEAALYRRYTVCGSGHMLGLDCHDCAAARSETYVDGVLEPGHVLTVEPGLYFQPDDLTVPQELRGIGVRIEDDFVITADGALCLSSGLPRGADEVEAWMDALR
ncbi:Xaa-Pro aminopeptidase [Streptomyces agglomeratus]|uniref:aminopeptidase P family protein n=1 Tax=Streptomyces agglomeratus TaxID=285458 RepID=UPI00085265C0|nr:Xaa-Pro aminopeptidase [Streptomyces agglomeratus]OEJ36831.1 Xaa-Pro aminopeptidase [Streptomyces agglomeratus]OEJ42001.1 Xaa-Pro aminopeptidase [Streptomyces agglomeratus]OEJ43619.1 Xaa-Pro aminopeptidase [Streptomyces agglomeratus]OEJ61861.1 Xaa-Pro aminopeptidase [Streptomyces agglomeratus]